MNLARVIDEEALFQELESEACKETREKIAALEDRLRATLSPDQAWMLTQLSDFYVQELGNFQSAAAGFIRTEILHRPCLRPGK